MATVGFGNLRRGMSIEIDNIPYEIIEYQRHKMQQRAPVTKLKVRSLLDSRVSEKTFQNYETEFTLADVESRTAQYLYTDGHFFHFMDLENYDQYQLGPEQVKGQLHYLKEEMTIEVSFYNGQVISLKLPTFVDLKVSTSPPGLKGDTAQGGTKEAILETGLSLQVPLFITEGEVIKVDTRTGEYSGRST